jgi:hypothetical protein
MLFQFILAVLSTRAHRSALVLSLYQEIKYKEDKTIYATGTLGYMIYQNATE